MSDDVRNEIAANAFTGVFLLIAGIGTLFMDQHPFVSIIVLLIGLFFLTRAIAQHQTSTD